MGRRLSNIKQYLEALRWVGMDDGDPQGSACQVPGSIVAFREGFERGLISNGNEVPGLSVFRGLCPPPGIQDGENSYIMQSLTVKLAHSV